ncbi:response regulator [Aeoliella sp. ICT_H6.2]|uniref:Response regulator n=1 Tax=Aeoliella straminimaris TaxID=2954799 RepID=A0A9X2F7Q3_9BACT|nr:response regulator [Aeoliella straminimaris]MCO6043907.1 response regulator [Aeoliella straminimaris]
MPKTALVVDDSRSLRGLVCDTLQEAGYKVLQSANGQEALETVANHPVDFVITDVNMPVLDGISLVKQLRTQPALQYVPILILTTEATAAMKNRGRLAGATGWMVKPFSPSQLINVVSRIVA